MFAAQYNTEGDQDIYILNDSPRWTDGVGVQFSVTGDLVIGLTQREARRPVASTLSLSMTYTSVVTGIQYRELENSLRLQQNLPVITPFWPGIVRFADRASAPIKSGRMLVWKRDWSSWIITTWDDTPAFDDNDFCAPALWGRLDARSIRSFRPDAGTFAVKFVETSKAAWAILPATVSWATGPVPGTGWIAGPHVFPIQVNFRTPAQTISLAIIREQIGFGRSPAETIYPQANRRNQAIDYVGQGKSPISSIIRFFLDHGNGGSFWASQWTETMRLTSDITSIAIVINVQDATRITTGDFLAFSQAGTIKYARVVSKTSTTVTLNAALGAAFDRHKTLVSQLVLSRFEKSSLSMTWTSLDFAKCNVSLVEVPAEYTMASGETLGTTAGLLHERAWVYEFSRVLNGSTVTSKYTSFEQSLSSGDYLFKDINHGQIKYGLFLDADRVEVKSFVFSGNPLLDLATMRMEVPLFVTIKSADVSGTTLSNVKTLFYGEVISANVSGSVVTGTAVAGGSLFDRAIPRPRFQGVCNNSLFDAGCKIVKANWEWDCLIHADEVLGTFGVTIEDPSPVNPNTSTLSSNFFALGYIEVVGDAGGPNPGLWQVRSILGSTAISSSLITLSLDRNFYPLVMTGDAARIVPGCDLSASTCRNKFSNYKNMFAHNFMPAANPSVVKSTTNSSGGGKK